MSFKDRRRRRNRRPATRVDSLAPSRLAIQIVILQTLYYVTAAVFILFTCLVAGTPFTLDLIFSWKTLRIDTTIGWTICLVWFLNSIFNVLFLTLFVGRSKLVFDFVLTIHGINLVITTLYAGHFPSSLLWWLLQIASISSMLTLGTWASRWRELNVIYFPPVAASTASVAAETHDVNRVISAGPSNDVEEYELAERQPDLELGLQNNGGTPLDSVGKSISNPNQ
ncbi:integral membrane protein S linking to the trans Golgi network-domain-containing protein [Lipomyces kononenkoae]|uniref:Integral membrane protein S linking to the trans Golgi network-domain-containing protein n=1 Tax=Lipomyces kononenkoae TaxID=34357 RepID=A0ACC3T3E4_LIPKO